MSNNIVYLQGPVMFAKVFKGNRDQGMFAPPGGQYTIDIGLKGNDVKMVKGWNNRYKAKDYKPEYSEGVVKGYQYFQFKRKHEQYNKDHEIIGEWSGPPKIVDEDGNDWDNRGLIGNGSVCTVKLNVNPGTYTDAKGKAWPVTFVRLEGIRVDEWVEFEGKKSDDTDDDDEEEDDLPNDGIPF